MFTPRFDISPRLLSLITLAAEIRAWIKVKKRILSLRISVATPRIMLTKRQEDILLFLRGRGRVKSPDIEKAFSPTRALVSQIIKPLIDAGLLIREGQTRATTYRLRYD